jgi:protein involved in polysaccharide export with SLBB domain
MRSMVRSVKILSSLLVVIAAVCLVQAPLQAGQLGAGGLTADSGALSAGPGEQMLQQLGIPPEQLQQLRQQSAAGGVGSLQTQRLCASVEAKHLSPDEAKSIGRTLGLSDDEVAQLVACARPSNPQSNRGLGAEAAAGNQTAAPSTSGASAIEKRFHAADMPYRLLAAPNLSKLKQFGYDLFSTSTQGLSTFDNVPVSPDYLIGPGDELNVLLWGRINRTLRLSVQRDGTVLMPQIGPLAVAGLSLAQARKLIDGQIGQIEGVQADVTMGRLRTIEVFVIGQVAEPGLQTVSALAHVSDALAAAGGVRKTGSLRRIELRRGNRQVGTVDLYAMLLHGDTSADRRLDPRDVIFVPVIGPVVGVAGDVKDPAIYELKGKDTLARVIRMTGGVSAFGYAQRVQVERVEDHRQRIALDVVLDSPQARSFVVGDGDLIKVFAVLPEQRNVVKLAGNVYRPGVYQWQEGMRVSDLVLLGQGVRENTFFGYALLKRRQGPMRTTHFIRVNLGGAVSDEASALDLRLSPGDTLTVYSVGEINEIPTVRVAGEVRKPGVYPLTDGMKVSDLIYEAGGLKRNAYLANAQLARTRTDGSRARYVYMDVDLQGALADMPADNIALRTGDELFVAEAANWHRPWTVQVSGEAMRPGPYVIHEGERLASVLDRCGGIRSDGYLPALILLRPSVRRMQEENLKRADAQLQTEITRAALMPAENGREQQQPNLQQKAEALAMLKNMITQAGKQQAIGRIVLTIPSLAALGGSNSNVALEDHDRIIIPRRPTSVSVMGQVYSATAVAYDPGLTIADYIDRAGGLTQDADKDQIFVVKANGAIMSQGSFTDSGQNRIFPLLPVVFGGFMDVHLQPGDTIYVPPSFLFVNPLQRTLDITQIIANSAEGIAYAALLGTLLP